MSDKADNELSRYAEQVGADPARLQGVFQRALEVVDVVRKGRSASFPTLAEHICCRYGIRVVTSDDENLKSCLGLTIQNPDGTRQIIVNRLTDTHQDRFVFYHELAHAMFHIQLLDVPRVTPRNIADVSEAEAWLFSVVCTVYDGLTPDLSDLRNFFTKLAPRLPARSHGLLVAVGQFFGANWRPLVEAEAEVSVLQPVIVRANDLLIQKIASNPALIRQVGSATFEDLMAELFSGLGYLVEQTQRTRDGGVDILAVKSMDDVSLRFLIECKRYAAHRKVDVTLVRSLFGVKHDRGASKAIIATTSSFTGPAEAFADAHRWDLELKDFDGIMKWVQSYLETKGRGPTRAWSATSG